MAIRFGAGVRIGQGVSGSSPVRIQVGGGGVAPTPVPYTVTYLAVGGGGGGGGGSGGGIGAGGGAGGYVTGYFTADPSTNYAIVVGAGGLYAPGTAVWAPGPAGGTGAAGLCGTNTLITATNITIVARGGGGGGGSASNGFRQSGQIGGSGGGKIGNCTIAGWGRQPCQAQIVGPDGTYSNYGYDGGTTSATYAGGGGGGAGGVGGCGYYSNGNRGGVGGSGRANSITGASVLYAIGGRGGGFGQPIVPPNTSMGGGGEGANVYFTPTCRASSGVQGGVILSVPTTAFPGSAPGATVTSNGGQTVITYTTSSIYIA